MRTGQRGIDLIKQFEGFRAEMYLDPVGLPTIGYGTLINDPVESIYMTGTITEKQALELLLGELYQIEVQLNRMVTAKINQNQFDSLASFCYNLGTGSLKRSTLLKRINLDPSNTSIRGEFNKWIHAGGKPLTGLVKRRRAESDLYFLSDIDMT